MPLSLRARVFRKVLPFALPKASQSPAEQRAVLDRAPALPDRRVDVVEAMLGGAPVLRVQPKGSRPARHILHAHGGGFVVGSARGFLPLLGQLARRADAVVTSVDYRLAPEHPFPAAIDDVVAAYRALVADVDPANLAVMGESAGGNAVVAALVRARDEGLPMPAAAVLLSPWLDLTFSGDSMRRNAATEVILEPTLFTQWRDAYVGGGDPADPAISPLFADLAGLPPIHVQATDAEVLEDDSRRFADAARAVGVDVDLLVVRDLWHVFQILTPMLPESNVALDRAVAFLRAHVGS